MSQISGSPSITLSHKKMLAKKAFLRKWYLQCYQQFIDKLPPDSEKLRVVELGSGAGFLQKILPSVWTSDIQYLPEIDINCSALNLPFASKSIDAFFALNAFHHFPDSKKFLLEIERCLKPGGFLMMVEPSNTLFANFIYRFFHHERFDTKSGWGFSGRDPMNDANGALPWIIFVRDNDYRENLIPALKLVSLNPHSALLYLISGGFSYPSLMPQWSFSFWSWLESIFSPFQPFLGLFYTITLTKEERHP